MKTNMKTITLKNTAVATDTDGSKIVFGTGRSYTVTDHIRQQLIKSGAVEKAPRKKGGTNASNQ